MRGLLRNLVFVVALAFIAPNAEAQSAADFYRGKTITLVTGTAGAGLYDLVARVVAEYLPRYVPGNPTTVIQPMPGASHVRATEYINDVAPRDGLVIGLVQPYVVLNKILDPSTPYHPEQLTWISRLLPLAQIGFAWHTAGVTTIEEAKHKSLAFGSAGATGPAATVPWTLNRMIGTRFRVVRGYADDSAEFLALERGELEGLGSATYGSLVRRPGYFDKHWVVPLYAIALQRLKQLPNVPAIVELTSNDRDREVLRVLATMPTIGVTIVAPPGVPQDRVETLRQAVAKMTQDPGFKSDMNKIELDVDPLSGVEVAALVSKALQGTPEIVKELREYTAPQD